MIWNLLARIVAYPPIANWLIERSKKTPYHHLHGYMERWWVFNPYPPSTPDGKKGIMRHLPSLRVHNILREDHGRHLHDHPWDARTFILRGTYIEERMMPDGRVQLFERRAGDTATLNFGEYHRIVSLGEEPVYTLFLTFRYRGTWGFLVNGRKVPHRAYQGEMP